MMKFNRMTSVLLTAMLLLQIFAALGFSAAASTYDLTIDGTQVTDQNCSDVLGNGVFSYDTESNTLTIKGDYTAQTNNGSVDAGLIVSSIQDLVIQTDADSRLQAFGNVLTLHKSTALTGDGLLRLISTNGRGIYLTDNTLLLIFQTHVDVTGKYSGITGPVSTSENRVSLYVLDSVVHASNTTEDANNYAIHRIYGGITLNGSSVTTPAGGYASVDAIVDANGNGVHTARIEMNDPAVYDLLIDGVSVDQNNRCDVLGDGVFSYDYTNRTLTVNGGCSASGDKEAIKNNGINGLTIDFVSASRVTSSFLPAIALYADTTITGSVYASCSQETIGCGIYVYGSTLTFKDAVVLAGGNVYGISGENHRSALNVVNSSILAAVTGTANTTLTRGAITGFDCGITLTDCYIDTPVGAVIDYGSVMDNREIASSVIIVPGTPDPGPGGEYDLYVNDVQVTDENKDDILEDGGSVTFDGQTLYIGCDIITDASCVVMNGVDGLIVDLAAGVTLSTDYGSVFELYADTLILAEGGAVLSSNDYGIYVSGGATLILSDANLDITADYGICGDDGEQLEIYISEISIDATYAVVDFGSILIEDCEIVSPSGAYVEDGCIKDANGRDAAAVRISTGASLSFDLNGDGAVNITDVTTLLDALAAGRLPDSFDVNADGAVNISDVTYLLDVLSEN